MIILGNVCFSCCTTMEVKLGFPYQFSKFIVAFWVTYKTLKCTIFTLHLQFYWQTDNVTILSFNDEELKKLKISVTFPLIPGKNTL